MKTATITQNASRPTLPYPNAATPRQQLHKFVDRCLVVASAVGVVAALMFLAVITCVAGFIPFGHFTSSNGTAYDIHLD